MALRSRMHSVGSDLVRPQPSEEVSAARRQAVSLAVSGCWFLVRELEIAGRWL